MITLNGSKQNGRFCKFTLYPSSEMIVDILLRYMTPNNKSIRFLKD